jgi:hypothetical protein
MSVTASRQLVEQLCARHRIPLLLLHDFDKSGFSIAATLQRDTSRYRFNRSFKIQYLGLRLEDVDGMEAEEVTHSASDEAVAANLKKNGATKKDVEFLLSQRVELNAFASDELVAFIERKLDALGIKKVVPDNATLKAAVHLARTKALVNEQTEALIKQALEDAEQMAAVSDLPSRVRALLDEHRKLSWDEAIALIVEEGA